MKLTVFIGGLSGGGAERVVCNLCNFLSKRHEVTILTLSNDKPSYPLNEKIKRISLIKENDSSNYLILNIKRVFRFTKYIKKSKANLFLVFLPIPTIMMLLHRKSISVPIIVSERNDPYTRYNKSPLKKFFIKKLYQNADGFVFQTKDAADFYKNFIHVDSVIIPNAINEEFIKEPYRGKREKRIVSVGRLTEQKNFPMLINSFNKISKDFPEYSLIIYGDGLLKNDLINFTKKLGIDGRVKFPGYVKNISDEISKASLFVLSSKYEGMPNALMEAMALGIPSISTDCPVGGPRFLIDDGNNGFLVPIGDEKLLAEKMSILLNNNQLAEKFSENGHKITERLNSNLIYSKWEEFINKVANKY